MTSPEFLSFIATKPKFLDEFKSWLQKTHGLVLKDILGNKSISLYPFILEYLQGIYNLQVDFIIMQDNITKAIACHYTNYGRNGKLGSDINDRTTVAVSPTSPFWSYRFQTLSHVINIINDPF